MRSIHSIVVHHSASGKPTTPQQITAWHKDRGFTAIGYHAVIWKTATGAWRLSAGRPESQVGAHCKGFNTGTIGVCVTGNYEVDTLEPEAVQILTSLLIEWCIKHNVQSDRIYGHREKGDTPTACPGARLFAQLPKIKQDVKKATGK